MYKDLKVTSGEVAANNVKSAPDRLQGTATENKNVFDKLVELFVGKYNALLDELDDNEIKAIDPITINGYTISHANSGVTQGMYGTDQEQDPQHGEKFIVPYIIVDEHGHIVSAGNSEVQLPSGGGGGTSDYDDLTDKPSINSVTLSGNKSASDLSLASASHSHTKSDISDFPSLATVATTGDYDDLSDKPSIPTKTSELTNDSGFITGYTETDPVFTASASSGISSSDITSWNGKSTVSFTRYTTSGTNIADIDIDGTTTKIYAPSSGGGGVTDYDQLTSRPQVNSVTLTGNKSSSDLGVADEVHTHTKSEITDFPSLATVATTGDYDDLSDKPTIPTKVSDLTNDSGFISSETDPIFTASTAYGISSSDVTNWNAKAVGNGRIFYGTCTTSASTTTKSVTCTAYDTLTTGDVVVVSFTKVNSTTAYLQMNVNSTGLKSIKQVRNGSLANIKNAGSLSGTCTFVYDGTYWVLQSTDDDTTYTIPTKTSDLTNDSGFITSETDPVFSASAASGISSSDISSWNGKSTVSLDRKTTSGTNIADLTINGTTTQLYAPTGGGGGGTITEVKTTAGTHQTIDVTSGTAQFAVPTDTNHLTNGAGFISTETDPVFSASAASGITSSDISTWNGKSDFSGDYDDLTNKPTIPTKVSDLTNDSGFITTETDPTVPSWAKASTKPTYTASEVGALPDTTTIPTKTSDLTNDSGFVSLITEEKSIKDNVSVSGSGTNYTDGNGSIAKTGYTPLGVVGFRVINASSGGLNGANVFISHAYISGTTAYFRVKNTESSAAKVRIYFTILYAKA
jgi:hypothetical protein